MFSLFLHLLIYMGFVPFCNGIFVVVVAVVVVVVVAVVVTVVVVVVDAFEQSCESMP